MTQAATAPSKADKFGTVEIGRDLFPPYVGRIVSWDVVDKEFTPNSGENAGQKRVWDELMFVVDPLDSAVKSTDGYARPSWKRTLTKSGKTPPNSVYAVLLANIAAVVGFPIKTSADLDRMVGMTVQFGQVDPQKDERFKAMTGEYAPKNPVVLLAKPPAGWEDSIPADLDAQKIAKMAEAVAAQEAKRQNEAAGVGESIQATAVEETAGTVSYDFDEETTSLLVSWLDGKKIASIGMTAYQDKELKAAVGQAVFEGLQKKSVQAHLKAMDLIVEGKDGLYHAGGAP